MAEISAGLKNTAEIFLHQDPLAQGSMHGYLSGDPQAVAVAVGPGGSAARKPRP
jgi:hypothetical protein